MWTVSEDRAFGFNFALSFISDIIVECKEAELYRILWIDKIGHLQEVSAVHAQKLIPNASTVNQLGLRVVSLEYLRHLVIRPITFKVRRHNYQPCRICNWLR